jgi:enoyl-CoA hydratase
MRSMSYMSDVIPAMRRIPQPVIAAINGPAYGGGMCLTLGSDIRYAAESAVFCSAGIINGLTSSELGVTYLLPRAIGTSNAGELLLTGRRISADEAHRIGLVSRIAPDGEVLDLALDTAEEMTTKLSCFGVMMTKQAMWSNLEISSLAAAIELENRNQLLAGYTGNLDEAIAAFREKRPPVYKE